MGGAGGALLVVGSVLVAQSGPGRQPFRLGAYIIFALPGPVDIPIFIYSKAQNIHIHTHIQYVCIHT